MPEHAYHRRLVPNRAHVGCTGHYSMRDDFCGNELLRILAYWLVLPTTHPHLHRLHFVSREL